MVRIKCINPKCTGPGKTFTWDEEATGGKMAQPYERGAVRLVVVCPACGAENLVWVKGAKTKDWIVAETDEIVRGDQDERLA